MKHFQKIVFVSVLGLGTPSLSEAQTPLENWGTSGDWEVLVDKSKSNGCLMQKTYLDGTLVRLGQLPAENGSYFAALNRDWTHIDATMKDEFYFDFGDELFSGEVVGIVEGAWHGGYAFFNNPEFIEYIGAKTEVTIEGSRRVPLKLNLKGSQRALAELMRCQSEQTP